HQIVRHQHVEKGKSKFTQTVPIGKQSGNRLFFRRGCHNLLSPFLCVSCLTSTPHRKPRHGDQSLTLWLVVRQCGPNGPHCRTWFGSKKILMKSSFLRSSLSSNSRGAFSSPSIQL